MTVIKKLFHKVRDDTGAALVTVLLLVSVMAAGAVVTFEALGYSVKRSTARKMYDQAQYFALGGEQLAVAASEKLRKFDARLDKPHAVSYLITGGRIDGVISDASNCFNINSLVVAGDVGALVVQQEKAVHYRRLLNLLGLSDSDAQLLTATLVDWLDSDNRPVAYGAEDYDYAALTPAYRAGNGLIADITELNSIKGYTPEVMDLIRPFLCVGYGTDPVALNVNTLGAQHAPLLAALIGGNFTVANSVELIASRPSKGYQDLADFWGERIFDGRTIEQAVREQTAVKPSLFTSRIRVQFHDAVSHLTSRIYVGTDNQGELLAHHFGVMQ